MCTIVDVSVRHSTIEEQVLSHVNSFHSCQVYLLSPCFPYDHPSIHPFVPLKCCHHAPSV